MTIVAEGVETYEELAYLHAATRIQLAQGYYFSKPIYLDGQRLTGARDQDSRPNPASRSFANSRAVAATRG